MIAMIDYLLRDSGISFRELANFDPALLLGDVDGSQELKEVPLALRDQLLFPYLAGAAFSVKVLDAAGGWTGLPRSVRETAGFHAADHASGAVPARGAAGDGQLPALGGIVPRGWKKLDENVMGEFGLNQVFKQFLGKERADDLAATWSGDRYAIYEQSPDGRTLLVIRVRLAGEAEAARFFERLQRATGKETLHRTSVVKQPNSFSFETSDGGVFIRCSGRDCLLAEGATRAQFEAMTRAMGWPAVRAGLGTTPHVAEATAWQPEHLQRQFPVSGPQKLSCKIYPRDKLSLHELAEEIAGPAARSRTRGDGRQRRGGGLFVRGGPGLSQ